MQAELQGGVLPARTSACSAANLNPNALPPAPWAPTVTASSPKATGTTAPAKNQAYVSAAGLLGAFVGFFF